MNRRVLKVLTVAAVCGTIAVALGMFLSGYGQSILVTAGGPHETLCFESSQLNSSTNMSLNLVNCGNYPATPLSYYVQDSTGNTYADPNWSVPTIPLNTHVTLNILIDGKAFTFQHGSVYTIELNTSRMHYTYTVTV
jgi:hypothetical protein